MPELHNPDDVQVAAETGALKDDGGKQERYDLIPVGPLQRLALLYGYGARKYSARNWEAGFPWSRPFNAMQRHIEAFKDGQIMDDGPGGSGLPHMTAVAWNAFAIDQFTITMPELNDIFAIDQTRTDK